MFGTPVKLELNELSAPGFVVAVLWVVFEVFLLIFYFNIAEEVRIKRKEDRILRRQEARVMLFLCCLTIAPLHL